MSMLREGVEDYIRYKADKKDNSMMVSAYRDGMW